ncbi:hypothetical protein ASU31_10390 [Pedobacter ginsenosidimutans]|uniref:Uncharacterized protein n=1 Tax=Pedobacter ginsenosidimutans TaxID=687842 RepID=A0A0T5VPV5_9SPHI|nr:hypothetical protein [Pedobacter ginsenosidimutans]KRT15911.1 hypothetical protein ASU31_10390 [Pedobacter ginsenosidimutans]
MANFTKTDLAYKGYKDSAWPDDDPKLTGKPDSTMLNRSESYEMVYFINRYMAGKTWKQKGTFNKIEAYLKEHKADSKSHAFWRAELDKNFKLN